MLKRKMKNQKHRRIKVKSKLDSAKSPRMASGGAVYYNEHARLVAGKPYLVIAACDAELIGKKLVSGDAVLDLSAYGGFFKGQLLSRAALEDKLRIAFASGVPSFNLVGKTALEVARKFTDVAGEKKIAGVPHLQVYRV